MQLATGSMLACLLLSVTLIPSAMAAADAGDSSNPCDGVYDTGCEEGAYTWCSPNQSGGQGYPSQDGTCAPGYQAQPRSGQYCAIWIAATPPLRNSVCIG